jgi:hypothetical protein
MLASTDGSQWGYDQGLAGLLAVTLKLPLLLDIYFFA